MSADPLGGDPLSGDDEQRLRDMNEALLVSSISQQELTAKAQDAEAKLRASEARLAYLLGLSDALRAIMDPIEIQAEACRLLGEHLDAHRAFYVKIDEAAGVAIMRRDAARGGSSPSSVEHSLSAHGWAVAILRKGQPVVVSDARISILVPEADRDALAIMNVVSVITVPLVRGGVLVGVLAVADANRRDWADAEIELVRETAERIWTMIARARAEAALRESEQRLQVMVAELQHRTRNLIAVTRSIANQTMARTGPTEAFLVQFNDRLAALGRVQGLLSRSGDEPITIGTLIRMELDALGAEEMRDRITLEGPEVALRNAVVQTLALALHELATNARKHGALATGHGHLGVTWAVRQAESGGRHLALQWIEDGTGDRRQPQNPTRKGYGRQLIERALPYALDAKTKFDLHDTGLRCTIDLPLTGRGGSREGE